VQVPDYLVRLRAIRPLSGDYGNKNPGDWFSCPSRQAERLEAKGLASRTLPKSTWGGILATPSAKVQPETALDSAESILESLLPTVIIPSRNANNLEACLNALWNHQPGCPVIVVNDGMATTPKHKLVREQRSPGKWLDGEKPFIFARNVNLGIKLAKGDIVIFNDDALLSSVNGFWTLMSAARTNPEYGLIAATCNVVGNINQHPQGIGLRQEPRMVCFVCVYIPRTTIERVGLLDVLTDFLCPPWVDDPLNLVRIVV